MGLQAIDPSFRIRPQIQNWSTWRRVTTSLVEKHNFSPNVIYNFLDRPPDRREVVFRRIRVPEVMTKSG